MATDTALIYEQKYQIKFKIERAFPRITMVMYMMMNTTEREVGISYNGSVLLNTDVTYKQKLAITVSDMHYCTLVIMNIKKSLFS
jgi:hypothetical protein